LVVFYFYLLTYNLSQIDSTNQKNFFNPLNLSKKFFLSKILFFYSFLWKKEKD